MGSNFLIKLCAHLPRDWQAFPKTHAPAYEPGPVIPVASCSPNFHRLLAILGIPEPAHSQRTPHQAMCPGNASDKIHRKRLGIALLVVENHWPYDELALLTCKNLVDWWLLWQ
jgi:hypothetical protein